MSISVRSSFVRNEGLYCLLKVLDFRVAGPIWGSAHFSSSAKHVLHGIATHRDEAPWGRCCGPFIMSHYVVDSTLRENVT